MTPGLVRISLDEKSKKNLRDLSTGSRREEVFQRVLKLFSRQGSIVAGRISRDLLAGQVLGRRSGTLARSIVGEGQMFRGLPSMRVGVLRGPALSYALVHEVGTKGRNPASPVDTIRPKKAKALAFAPEGSPALTPAGVDRFGGPRNYPGELRFVPFRKRGGTAVGALYDEADFNATSEFDLGPSINPQLSIRDLQAVYILLEKLDLPPRKYLSKGLDLGMPRLLRELADLLARLAAGGTR